MHNFSHEIETASSLARKAGKVVLDIYQKDFAVMYKGSNDPVTAADQEANGLIIEGLHSHFPQDILVAEESPLPLHSLIKGRVWYIDPLDGTKEFISRNGEFSIMIGLAIDARSTLGVVYWPVREYLYIGLADTAAWMDHHGVRQELNARQLRQHPHIRLVSSRSHRSPILSAVHQSLPIHHEQQMGSVGLKIAHIAQGEADLYVDPGSFTKSWDACAPEAILRGAGGCFTDIHGKPIQYGLKHLRNLHGLVGSTQDCHQRVIKALTGLCSSCEG